MAEEPVKQTFRFTMGRTLTAAGWLAASIVAWNMDLRGLRDASPLLVQFPVMFFESCGLIVAFGAMFGATRICLGFSLVYLCCYFAMLGFGR